MQAVDFNYSSFSSLLFFLVLFIYFFVHHFNSQWLSFMLSALVYFLTLRSLNRALWYTYVIRTKICKLFSLINYFNYIVFDMFRTTKCWSTGRLVHAYLWYFFMHPYKQSGRCQEGFDIYIYIYIYLFMYKDRLYWIIKSEPRQFSVLNNSMYLFVSLQ